MAKMGKGHPRGCTCRLCHFDRHGTQGNDSFEKKLPDGTTIYGPKSTEGRPVHMHGHRGDDFNRTPHSTIGSAAIGDPHTFEEHKKKRTKRW